MVLLKNLVYLHLYIQVSQLIPSLMPRALRIALPILAWSCNLNGRGVVRIFAQHNSQSPDEREWYPSRAVYGATYEPKLGMIFEVKKCKSHVGYIW